MRVVPSAPRLGLLLVVAAVLAPVAGCLVSGGSGDPASGFFAGSGGRTGSGYAGSYGSGSAGSTRSDGGARDATGTAGSGSTADGGKLLACQASATATFQVAWTLENAMGAATTCDAAGAQTVDVSAVNLITGARADSTVPCAALKATTCAMPAGDYSLSLTLRAASGASLSEIVAPVLSLTDNQITDLGSLPFETGGDTTMGRGFALTWSIDDFASGATLTCADAGAQTVRVLAGTKTFDMTCAPGKGRTTAIAPGDYTVALRLLDGTGAELSVTNSMTLHVGAGQLVYLGEALFDVN
jgi:hypothetical protein